MNRLYSLFISIYLLIPDSVFANSIEGMLHRLARNAQKVVFAILPLMMIYIGYLYKRGKSDAKEKLESLIIGVILVSTAFLWASFFK